MVSSGSSLTDTLASAAGEGGNSNISTTGTVGLTTAGNIDVTVSGEIVGASSLSASVNLTISGPSEGAGGAGTVLDAREVLVGAGRPAGRNRSGLRRGPGNSIGYPVSTSNRVVITRGGKSSFFLFLGTMPAWAMPIAEA